MKGFIKKFYQRFNRCSKCGKIKLKYGIKIEIKC